MKLVIHTQIKENYGAHDWDEKGECPQRWKFKGGNTYVVNNLSEENQVRLKEKGIPNLEKLICEDNEYFQEYVLDYSLVSDEETPWEKWETPVEFVWGGDRWLATRTINNDKYSYMREDILAKREEWIPQAGGERAHYKSEYLTENGWGALAA